MNFIGTATKINPPLVPVGQDEHSFEADRRN